MFLESFKPWAFGLLLLPAQLKLLTFPATDGEFFFFWQVTPNLYGNLVANTAAGIAGGTGVMPGGNNHDLASYNFFFNFVFHDVNILSWPLRGMDLFKRG